MILDLCNEIDNAEDIYYYSYPIEHADATTIAIDDKYAIFIDENKCDTQAKRYVALAHEMGHIATGALHKVYSPLDLIEKHEYKADKYAVHKIIPIDELLHALLDEHLTTAWELAEYFEVTEYFIKRAMYIYECERAIPA